MNYFDIFMPCRRRFCHAMLPSRRPSMPRLSHACLPFTQPIMPLFCRHFIFADFNIFRAAPFRPSARHSLISTPIR